MPAKARGRGVCAGDTRCTDYLAVDLTISLAEVGEMRINFIQTEQESINNTEMVRAGARRG